jgi:uncharacterized protein (TIGR03643 family)
MNKSAHHRLISGNQSRIIEMAWEDRTTFEAIKEQFGLDESSLMKLMKKWLKRPSYLLWRERVKTRSMKHEQLRAPKATRAFAYAQYKHKK